jgi:trans-2,3-dihydro-3-hydroxyanthranilate isomerase
MFAPRFGIFEDSATGSAAAAFAGAFCRSAPPSDGTHDIVIEQGYEIGRPSLITLSITVQNHELVGAAIGGEAVAVTEGTIDA